MGKYVTLIKNWRSQSAPIKWVAKYTKPFLPKLMALMGLDTLGSLGSVTLALISRRIIDSASAGLTIRSGIFMYVGVVLISLLLNGITTIMGAMVNERFAFSIRAKLYDNVLNTCWSDISRYHSGDILTRLTSDIDIVASGVSEVIPSILSLATTFVAAFVTLAFFNVGFALFALFLGPIAAVISVVMGRIMRRIQQKVQESESAYKSSLQETVSNMVVIKAFEGQGYAGETLTRLRNERLYWLRKRQKISAVSGAGLSGAFQLSYIAAFAWSSFQLSVNSITYGTMSVFLSMVMQIQGPLLGLSRLIPRLVMILTSAGRLIELEHLPLEDMSVVPMEPGPMGLEVDNLSFGYTDEPVLENADLHIRPGEFVALMGSSGIGKTTLLRLIMAYYPPGNGRIRLTDETGRSAVVTAGARKYMSYVPQGNTLMSGTIADNLRLGRADATEEEMWRMLEVVMADKFVRGTPDGLNTVIGERGLGLSEGQAQRIAIARALIRRAPLLILDEATSALDEKTEEAVLTHLRQNRPRPTCIIVTHRRSVLKYCERWLKVDDRTIRQGEQTD